MDVQRDDGRGLWEFLDDYGIGFGKADFPWLTADNPPRVLSILDFSQYMLLQGWTEAVGFLYKGLGRTLSYIGPVMDAELSWGFNDHTDRHTLWVAQTGLELLGRAGKSYDGERRLDRETELLVLLVGMIHDLGNLMARKGHSAYSVDILRELFANRGGYEKQWQAVEQAVLYHDEPALVKGDFKLDQGWPLLWGLVMADKMHVGRSRVGDKSLVTGPEGAIEADPHVVLNCLVAGCTWYLAGESFVWRLDFSVEQLEEKFVALSNNKERVWVPDEYQRAFRKQNIPYRETFSRQFMEVYGERVALAAGAAFLLFPNVREFQLVLSDCDVRGKVGQAEVVMHTVARGG